MTVIAWDGKTLAADKQATLNRTTYTTTKISKHGQALVAIVGTYVDGAAMLNWFLSGMDPEKFPKLYNEDDACLWVFTSDSIVRFEGSPYPITVEDTIVSDGSGGGIALGAMLMGADAVTAVKLAMERDIYSGGGIDVLQLGNV